MICHLIATAMIVYIWGAVTLNYKLKIGFVICAKRENENIEGILHE
jgi:hypothetical protein